MNFFDKYFVFSHSEKKGILLFLLIIFILCVVYWVIPRYFIPEPQDYSEVISKMKAGDQKSEEEERRLFPFNPNVISKDSLLLLGFSPKQAWNLINFRNKVKLYESKSELKKLYAMNDSLYNLVAPYVEIPEKNEIKPKSKNLKISEPRKSFLFDPNTISKDSLKLLGLSDKLAQTVINYRTNVGDFKTKEDFKKVYGLSSQEYNRLTDYIELAPKITENTKEKPPQLVNLNRANKEELMLAKGIGNVFSDRIIEHRERTGGFVSVSQLTEIYGIDHEWLENYEDQFVAEPSSINQININTIRFKELLKHPYFSYSQTQLIINYREQHGKFSSIEQIREFNLIKPKHYRKIAPYLTLE